MTRASRGCFYWRAAYPIVPQLLQRERRKKRLKKGGHTVKRGGAGGAF
jgi:predicted ABC-type ATPase